MIIKDLVRYVDNRGYTVAYVIFLDNNGKENYARINSEQEYNYYYSMFEKQKSLNEKINKKHNTPQVFEYKPKEQKYMLNNQKKNLRVAPKLTAILLGIVVGVSTTTYALNKKNNKNYTVINKIQTEGLFRSTKESRYIENNVEKFATCATALITGNYENIPEFDAEFIRNYIHNCYLANINDLINGGKLDGARYDFNFEEYMTMNDQIAYETRANNPGYELVIKKSMGDFTLEELTSNNYYKNRMEKYLKNPLEFMLQHLDHDDDEFTKLSPFARIVICEEAKSILQLEDEGFSFFNHANPKQNQNRDDLIAAIDKKEEQAMFYLNRQIENKSDSKQMEGRSR